MTNLASFFRGVWNARDELAPLHPADCARCGGDTPYYRADHDVWAGDRDTDKQAAHDATAWRAWVEREITLGNLTPAARNMPADDVVWQWEQYTGRTYRV